MRILERESGRSTAELRSLMDLVRTRLSPHPQGWPGVEQRPLRLHRVRVAAERLERGTRLRRLDPRGQGRPPER
jgi:hypothetical protein